MPVQTPCAQYEDTFDSWQKCRDVAAGERAVKAAGVKYLPALGDHKKDAEKYNAYKTRALFYNAVSRTIDGLAGAILQKTPTVTFPKQLKNILDDVTLTSVPFEMLALETLQEVLEVGRHGILVDMATADAPEQRPYAVLYEAENIVSWRTERRGGDEVLTRVVLCEGVEIEDPNDPFITKTSKRYRVCELIAEGYVQTLWTKQEGEGAESYIAGEPTTIMRRGAPLDFIPFAFVGPTSISPDIQRPPLEDLADINLSHYRGYADLKHGLHYTALPTPVVMGGTLDKDEAPLAIGSGVAWQLEKGGDAKMLEFSGAGLSAIREDLQDMQRMMATLGARLLEEQPTTAETAAAVGMRHAGEHATLRTIAQAVEQGLTHVLQWLAWWMGTQARPGDTGALVELNKDFFATRLSSQDLRALVMALQADSISYATFYAALERGELARPGVTAADEQKEIERTGAGRVPETWVTKELRDELGSD